MANFYFSSSTDLTEYFLITQQRIFLTIKLFMLKQSTPYNIKELKENTKIRITHDACTAITMHFNI